MLAFRQRALDCTAPSLVISHTTPCCLEQPSRMSRCPPAACVEPAQPRACFAPRGLQYASDLPVPLLISCDTLPAAVGARDGHTTRASQQLLRAIARLDAHACRAPTHPDCTAGIVSRICFHNQAASGTLGCALIAQQWRAARCAGDQALVGCIAIHTISPHIQPGPCAPPSPAVAGLFLEAFIGIVTLCMSEAAHSLTGASRRGRGGLAGTVPCGPGRGNSRQASKWTSEQSKATHTGPKRKGPAIHATGCAHMGGPAPPSAFACTQKRVRCSPASTSPGAWQRVPAVHNYPLRPAARLWRAGKQAYHN